MRIQRPFFLPALLVPDDDPGDGRVADAATGEPHANFRVRLVREGETEEERGGKEFPLPRTRGYQDSQGRFRRGDLVPGIYFCRVSATGFVPLDRKLELYAGMPREEEFLLAQAGRIRGVVLDSVSQQPIPGATVRFSERPGATSRGANDTPAADVREETPEETLEEDRRALRGYWGERSREGGQETGEDGTCLIEGVPLQTVAVVAEHPEYIPQVLDDVRVDTGQESRLSISLKPGRSISGTVVDASEEPAPGRFVFLRGVSDGSRHVRKSASANPRGEFRIAGLPKGTYRVFSPGPGAAAGAPAVVVVVEGDARDVRLRIGEE